MTNFSINIILFVAILVAQYNHDVLCADDEPISSDANSSTGAVPMESDASGHSDSADSSGSGAKKDKFRELYDEVFGRESDPLQPSEIIERLNEMHHLMAENPELEFDTDIDDEAVVAEQVETFRSISNDYDCSNDRLEYRFELEQLHREHPNLGPFLVHQNRQHFDRCAQQLNHNLNQVIEASLVSKDLSQFDDISQAVGLIRSKQHAEGDEFSLNVDIDLVALSKGLFEYLENIGQEIDKPIDRPMHEHVNIMNGLIERYFGSNCRRLLSRQLADGNTYQESVMNYLLIRNYDQSLRQLFSPQVLHLIDQLHACSVLSMDQSNLYPLARYDLNELTDKILSTQPQDESMRPEVIRDLLDKALFVGQSQLLIGLDNPVLMKRFIGLSAVGQVRADKCHQIYIRGIIEAKQVESVHPNLLNYLHHFGQLQAIECLPNFSFAINAQLSQLTGNCDLILIEDVKRAFEMVVEQVDPTVRLYNQLPPNIVGLSIKKFLTNHNVSLDQDEENNPSLIEFRPTLNRLFGSCLELVEKLGAYVNQFEDLLELAQDDAINYYNPGILRTMSRYRICHALTTMTPEMINF